MIERTIAMLEQAQKDGDAMMMQSHWHSLMFWLQLRQLRRQGVYDVG